MGLSILSQNLLIELLSQWIDTIDLVSYDTAICNHAMRELYYSLGIELALFMYICMYVSSSVSMYVFVQYVCRIR